MPLWPENLPGWAADAWAELEDHLLKADKGWVVWTTWYEDRLHGRRFNKPLEEARVLIPRNIWEQGQKTVDAEIVRLIVEHAEVSTPQGEQLIFRPETRQVGIQAASVSERGGYENACDKVFDRYERLINDGLEHRFSTLRPVIDDLETAFARHRDNPRRMHDTFATGVRNIAALLETNEIPDDLLVINLQKDMADAVIDIREAVPEVMSMTQARAKPATSLSAEEAAALERIFDRILETGVDGDRIAESGRRVADALEPSTEARIRRLKLVEFVKIISGTLGDVIN